LALDPAADAIAVSIAGVGRRTLPDQIHIVYSKVFAAALLRFFSD